jgi:predicted nucleic-acid-binding Zn-ribbon protein
VNPYDPDATCPKCGCQQVNTYYCTDYTPWYRERRNRCPGGEHLHRACSRCRYEWFEAPLDQAADNPSSSNPSLEARSTGSEP